MLPSAGTAGTALDLDSLLNSTESRFGQLADAQVNVCPEGVQARKVRRRIITPEDDLARCYLIAKDIVKVWSAVLPLVLYTLTPQT